MVGSKGDSLNCRISQLPPHRKYTGRNGCGGYVVETNVRGEILSYNSRHLY